MTDAQRLEKLTQRLLDYFAAIGARAGHVFELRDINHQVMMNVFAADERAVLDAALDGLVAGDVLRRVSASGWSLTDAGLEQVNRLRSASGRSVAGVPGVEGDDAVARGLSPTRRRRIPVAR